MGRIWVFGGANVDIQGAADGKLVEEDSNIGKIRYSFGGVGRNIAENLARLGDQVSLVSAFGSDLYGVKMKEDCARLGIDLSHSLFPDHVSSTYLAILDDRGEMRMAVNDMSILDLIRPEDAQKAFDRMKEGDLAVVDANLAAELLGYIFANCPVPIAADPISTAKTEKMKPYLSKMYLFKPNKYEAAHLSGIPASDEKGIWANIDFFRREGVRNVVISLGRDGSAAGGEEGCFRLRHSMVDMKSATGAGDAFLAGIAHVLEKGGSLREAARFGCGCAAIAVKSERTVSEEMREENVLRTLEELQIRESGREE